MGDGAVEDEAEKLIQPEEKAFLGNETPKASVLQQVVLVCNVASVLGLLCFAAYSLVSSFVSEPVSGSTGEVASYTDPSVINPSWHLPPQGSLLLMVLMGLAFATLACLPLSPLLLQARDYVQIGDWSWIKPAECCVACTASSLTEPVKDWAFWAAGTSLRLLAVLAAVFIALSSSSFPAEVVEVSTGVHTSPLDAQVSNATKMGPAMSAEAHVRNATDRHRLRSFEGRVPGSKLKSAKEVAAARSSLACLAQRGRWVFNPQPRRLPWKSGEVDICDVRWCKADRRRLAGPRADRVRKASKWNIRTGLKYEWQPNKECGQYPPFQPVSFCAVMKRLGGPLLLAGDSLTRNMHESLHNMQQVTAMRKRDFMYTPYACKQWETSKQVEVSRQLCRAMALCGPKLPVVRVRNDRLSLVEGSPVVKHAPTEYYLPWLSLIKRWHPKAVLLNRGPHYTENAEFAKELEQAFMVLRERHPDLLILYRSSVAGHAGCEKFEVPLRKPQVRALLPFHWGKMHEQNGIAKRIVEKYGGVFLDIEPMTELRGDGHRGEVRKGARHDCLHYCLPGPVDEWNRLLLHALSILV